MAGVGAIGLGFGSAVRRCAAAVCLVWAIPWSAGAETAFPERPFLRLESGMHTAPIIRIDVDAAGRYLVTGSNDKTARIWDLRDGRLLRTLRVPLGAGNVGKVYAVALSPDGDTVAVGGWTGPKKRGGENIYFFDRASGVLKRLIAGLPNVIIDLTYSKDGRYLAATIFGANGVRVYETKAYTEVAKDSDYGDHSLGADFDAAGRLVTSSYDGYLRLYDARFRLIEKRKAPGGNKPFSVAFSPDGRRVAVGYYDSTRVDLLSGEDLAWAYSPDRRNVDNGDLSEVAWSHDGRFLYAGGRYDKSGWNPVRRWGEAGRGEFVDFGLAKSTVMGLRPLHDGGLAMGAADPLVAVLGADGGEVWKQKSVKAQFKAQLSRLLLSERGDVVRFGYEAWGKRPARFSVTEAQLRADPPSDPSLKGAVTTGLGVTGWKNTYSPKLNGAPLTLEAYEFSRSLAVAPDRRHFLLGTEWSLRLFDRAGEQQWWKPVPDVAWAVNISGDGRLAVAAYGDGTIRWHRMTDGEELLALFPHQDGKRWIAWTPTGYYQASAGGEDLIGWHLNNGAAAAPGFFPASRFRDTFYRPDVVAHVLQTLDEDEALRRADQARGARTATRDVRATRPPVVAILAPAEGSPITETKLTLMYEAVSKTGPITGIEARVDGRPARVIAHRLSYRNERRQVIGQMTVEVPPANAVVSIIASNKHGTGQPADYAVNWTGGKDWYKPDLYVLAVGVSKYNDDNLDLKFAAKDAKDFVEAVETQKGRGLYRTVTTKLLPDKKATRTNILNGMDWLEKQTGSRDVAILFLAGHGIKGPDGKYHFLSWDADFNSLRRTTVRDFEFMEFLGAVAGKTLMFQDTCFSGKLMANRQLRAGDSRADVDRFANELADAVTGVIVFSSSTENQFSKENEKWGNGAFTKALVEGIREGKADFTKDLHVSVAELEVYISDRVKALTGGGHVPHPVSRTQVCHAAGLTDNTAFHFSLA